VRDPYAVLGVAHDATREEIEHAFRVLAAAAHPDRVAYLGPEAVLAATAAMADLEVARHVLADPLLRAQHDVRHGIRSPADERPPPGPHQPGVSRLAPRTGGLRSTLGAFFQPAGIRGIRHGRGGSEIFVGRGHHPTPGLLSTPDVAGAVLIEARITPDDIRELSANSTVRSINLQSTFVGDQEVVRLCTLPDLHRLDLDDTPVTDGCCAALGTAPKLDDLALNDTAVTDRGMVALGRSRSLRSLQLRGTSVTAAGLAELDEVPLRLLALPKHLSRHDRHRLADVHPSIQLF